MTMSMAGTDVDANSRPTGGSNLTEQIYLVMKGCYFPASSTMGEFWKKQVLLEFIENQGMPLGRKTIQDAVDMEDKWLTWALDKLMEEGYIQKVDSPANFLFQGTDGDGYELIMIQE